MIAGCWIVDTNVVVSGVITSEVKSPAAVTLNRMLGAGMRFVLCEVLAGEYRQVLLRPRIRRVHGLDENTVDQLLEALINNAIIVDITARTERAPDPGDHHLWRLLAARPDAGLITGDALLIRNSPPGSVVLTARDFMSLAPDSGADFLLSRKRR